MKTHFSLRLLAVGAVLLIAALIFSACTSSHMSFTTSSLETVEETSTSRISRNESILIRFKEPIQRPELIEKSFTFSKKSPGNFSFPDDRTIEFTPKTIWKASRFVLFVDTGLLNGSTAGISGFQLNFEVIPPSFEVLPEGLVIADSSDSQFSFSGILLTDIPIKRSTAEKMVSASLGKKPVTIEWSGGELTDSRRFTITSISQKTESQYLRLLWNGKPCGAIGKGEKTWLVPQAGDFSVLEIATENKECIQVRFSKSLDSTQDIRGFIRTGTDTQRSGNTENLRYSIQGNVLSIYNTDEWKANSEIEVLEGIKSNSGQILAIPVSASIEENWELPDSRFATEGVILPPTSGVIVPIETMNVSGLIVEAWLISADNILQFLQVNELDEYRELRRVGEPIWSDAFDFNWDSSMKNRWVPRGLDLSDLVKKHPNGMIQLRITFRSRHVMYQCNRSHPDFAALPMPSDAITLDSDSYDNSYWDMTGDMDWKVRRTYWDYKNDPCHPAFYLEDYNRSITKRKNILISDLGVLTKKDTDGQFHITVAQIGSTEPVSGAKVTLYSYAKQALISATTDSKGMVSLKSPKEPYFITAEKNKQTSYIRIDSGMALSTSHFQIDGQKAIKGVKGFIYGERGVWRPGDTMHLVFIMQDTDKTLPKNFPILFELEDPLGRITQSATYTNPVGDFYRIDTGTNPGDSTGSWTARVRSGGQVWTKKLRVEAIMPNRLAINLEAKKTWLSKYDNDFTLSGAWLHGAKAPGLKADMAVTFLPGKTTFAGYEEYTFVNSEKTVESEQHTVWEGYLDSSSIAHFSLAFDAGSNLPGMLRAQIATRIFEPSGQFSIEHQTMDFSPYDRYVGLKLPKGDADRGMLLTNTKHRVDIAVLDPAGKPYNSAITLSMAVYKLEWRWWWEKDALTSATYVSGRSTKRITEGTTVARNGRASWDLEIAYPEWGRYLVVVTDEQGGHSAAKIVYIDWPGWAGRSSEGGSGSASMLTLQADKKEYRTGDTATVSFSSNTGGTALVTIEKDGKVLKQEWLATKKDTTVYAFSVTADMTPNIYVHISLLQKHLQTANSLPIRLYGIVPIMAEDPNTRLSPQIASADQFEPGKPASIRVTEATGKPMTCTVAVVDEGLLGLTRFKTENPWNEMYRKEASRLESWDLYRYVLSAFGGKLETLLSIGGSEDILDGGNKKTERFKPVVQFFGPFEVAANGDATIDFEMPAYVGAVRIMVVSGKNAAYGTAEKTVIVKSPLMILSSLPRTLGTNETIEVPVTLFNGTETNQTAIVKLQSSGALKTLLTTELLIPPLGDATTVFRIQTSTPGQAIFTAEATTANGNKATSTTEIDIISRGTPTVTAENVMISSGETKNLSVKSPGEMGTKTMSVELSTLPVIDLSSAMKFLLGYPHGCIEQITSKAFPQLFIADIMDCSDSEKETMKTNVLSVIDRYSGYQTSGGGFAYWPGKSEANIQGTSFAGHFMVEARRAGYAIPDTLYKPWLEFQKDEARAWRSSDSNSPSMQAYRLYTLAIAGSPELGAMNRLLGQQNLDAPSKWFLAAAYTVCGQKATAEELTQDLSLRSPSYRETGYAWGSNTRDIAIALNTLNLMNDTNRASRLLPDVAEELGSGNWHSTHETFWLLLSLAPHYRGNKNVSNTSWELTTSAEKKMGTVERKALLLELAAEDKNEQNLSIRNTGKKPLYGKVITRGMLKPGDEKPMRDGLALTVNYVNANGYFIDPETIKQGDSFEVRISVQNKTQEKIDNIVLSMPIPTCWEFGNPRLGADNENVSDSDEENSTPNLPTEDYRDMQDTYIRTYFSLERSKTNTYSYYATMVWNGNYRIPAIRAEAMYNNEIQAVIPGRSASQTTKSVIPAVRAGAR